MHITRIVVFPIKSLDGVEIPTTRISDGGTLAFDRMYAIVDPAGKIVNAKREPRVIRLRCQFAPDFREICIWQSGAEDKANFDLQATEPIDRWMTQYFGYEVKLQRSGTRGFPDDEEAYGPTFTSEASLQAVTEWFPELTIASTRRRFRTNIELYAAHAFEEDMLFGAPGERRQFRAGAVSFLGHNPCQRCAVPSRDPETSGPLPLFQAQFAASRKAALPAWSNELQFNHYYRFAVNTSIP